MKNSTKQNKWENLLGSVLTVAIFGGLATWIWFDWHGSEPSAPSPVASPAQPTPATPPPPSPVRRPPTRQETLDADPVKNFNQFASDYVDELSRITRDITLKSLKADVMIRRIDTDVIRTNSLVHPYEATLRAWVLYKPQDGKKEEFRNKDADETFEMKFKFQSTSGNWEPVDKPSFIEQPLRAFKDLSENAATTFYWVQGFASEAALNVNRPRTNELGG